LELTIAGYGPAADAMKEQTKASAGITFAG